MPTAGGPLFSHQRLENAMETTRILHLEPSKSFHSPLRCHLGIIRIPSDLEWLHIFDDEGPPPIEFEALSYVWGSPSGDRELICEGKTLLITENCEAALRRLRLRRKVRTLWVDSICID